MSQENVEVVYRGFGFLNSRDWDAAMALVDTNVEFVEDARVPGASTYRGRSQIRQYFESLPRLWESFEWEIERCIDRGDDVVVFGTVRARGKKSGVEVSRELYHVFTFRNGKVVRVRMPLRRSEALEAAGLSE